MNRLYYGDCLAVMQGMPQACVDLIYLDPPFNSNRAYNAIYKSETGKPLPDQIEAFCDAWNLDEEREREIRSMPVLLREAGIADEVVDFWKLWMNALRHSQPRLLAYLAYMVPRLLQMKVLLKPTGSIYLHCDPTASHYIKVMMDAVFGHRNFKNEIIWSYRRWPSKSKNYQTMHDVILFYVAEGGNHTFNVEYEPPSKSYLKRFKGKTQILDPETKTRKIVVDEPTKGLPRRDVWELSILAGSSKERLGYPTQKPLTLLDRIIRASSNKGDVVMDPFCGCATTLEAAHNLERKWIGIDIAIHAIKRVAKQRLLDRLGLVEGKNFSIEGIPRNLEGSKDLWKRDKYQFQKWAVEQADGFVTANKTADRGIDGRLYFFVPPANDIESMIIEVKGGTHVSIADVRSVRGAMENHGAPMAGLIVMEMPKERQLANFRREMATAGDFSIEGHQYPKMQIISVPDLLAGRRFLTPTVAGKAKSGPAEFEHWNLLAPKS